MAKDYAKKYIKYKYLAPKRKNNRSLWVMLVISFSLFILGLLLLKPVNKLKPISPVQKIVNKKIMESPSPPPPEPKFDFYNILPQENFNLSSSGNSSMKEASTLTKAMTTDINNSSAHRPIDTMLSPTPEQVAMAEAKKQLEQEMGQLSNVQYLLVLGNFTERVEAEQLQAQALLKGFPVRKKISSINGKTMYQIFIGPSDLNKLTLEQKRLNRAGLNAILIKIN